MVNSQRYLWLVALGPVLLTAIAGAPFAQQCPQHAHVTKVITQGKTVEIRCRCDDGYSNENGACRHVGNAAKAQCVRAAGVHLRSYKEEVCASAVSQCFSSHGTTLSGAALNCVVQCADIAMCPAACGLSVIAVEDVVDECMARLNSCFESALAQHAQAVHACQQD